jgi:ubiquinone/menaquinone biosynthesis C-methylase UbiE
VVDVCGGHGALALLFLAHGQAQQAKIIDPQRPASHATLRRLGGGGWRGLGWDDVD